MFHVKQYGCQGGNREDKKNVSHETKKNIKFQKLPIYEQGELVVK